MKSARAIAVGLCAEIVAIFAFYGLAQAQATSGRLLAVLFLTTLALIGVVATWLARRNARPGAGKGVAMLVSVAIFAALVLLLWASVESLQDG